MWVGTGRPLVYQRNSFKFQFKDSSAPLSWEPLTYSNLMYVGIEEVCPRKKDGLGLEINQHTDQHLWSRLQLCTMWIGKMINYGNYGLQKGFAAHSCRNSFIIFPLKKEIQVRYLSAFPPSNIDFGTSASASTPSSASSASSTSSTFCRSRIGSASKRLNLRWMLMNVDWRDVNPRPDFAPKDLPSKNGKPWRSGWITSSNVGFHWLRLSPIDSCCVIDALPI